MTHPGKFVSSAPEYRRTSRRNFKHKLEDSIKTATPTDVYKEGPYLEHGRIESRICRIYRGEELIK